MPLDIPEPPEGYSWKYVQLGETIANTDDGKDLVSRLEAQGVVVEILVGGGYQALYQPELPPGNFAKGVFTPEVNK